MMAADLLHAWPYGPRRSDEEGLERRVDAHLELVKIQERVAKHRAEVLAKPLPRNECPGCFMAIYDGAAEQGWCCDCFDYVANKPRNISGGTS
jgi:hypothetical protein